jgi:hypothetical protein
MLRLARMGGTEMIIAAVRKPNTAGTDGAAQSVGDGDQASISTDPAQDGS